MRRGGSPISRREFIKRQAKAYGAEQVSSDGFEFGDVFFVAAACQCQSLNCDGWVLIPIQRDSISITNPIPIT